MHAASFLTEEISNLGGTSRGGLALCCAIIEDAETARAFEIEPRGAIEMMRAVTCGPTSLPSIAAPPPRELTSLIARG